VSRFGVLPPQAHHETAGRLMPDRFSGLPRGPLLAGTAHLCIDMQALFAEDTPWHAPWMKRVLPRVAEIAAAHPRRNVFTRFIPPAEPDELPGSWRNFYERWREITTSRLDPRLLELVEPLRGMAVHGTVVDKRFFSPFHATGLADALRRRGIDCLVITGAETDMCVLAAVLDAVDFGFRVVLPTDALCSSSDAMHDALIALYENRFSQQIETAETETVLACWLD